MSVKNILEIEKSLDLLEKQLSLLKTTYKKGNREKFLLTKKRILKLQENLEQKLLKA